MVGNEEEITTKKTGLSNELVKNIVLNAIEYLDNITDLDLSNRNISSFSEDLELPTNIVHLKLSNNRLTEVPPKVLNLNNLKTLDLSFNSIVFFDDTPSFCHTIEWLNLSNNTLKGPPFWVWAFKAQKLVHLNLSNNSDICDSFPNGYFEEFLQYTTLVSDIDVHNCRLNRYIKLMMTFRHAKVICLGSEDYRINNVNYLENVPCAGLEQCCDVEKLNLANTQLYNMNPNIDIYKNLKELNLSQNNINSLPNEFSNLNNLETCLLSFNKLLYLPDNMFKLTKLVRLHLDNNKLCMLPENIHEIPNLKVLDIYNNNLWEGLNSISHLDELDFAQNNFEEPSNDEYVAKKQKLRINFRDRVDGRKIECYREDSEYTKSEADDEELYDLDTNGSMDANEREPPNSRSSSPEDWDSDDYWIPQYYNSVTSPSALWKYFVQKKMEEGNFCPVDAHPESIAEIVKNEKLCNPLIVHESDGQFDDYSDDDS